MKPRKHSNILGILSGLLSLTLIRFPMIARDCALLFSSLLHGNRAGAIIHHLHTCGLWREVSTLFRIIFLITQKVHAKVSDTTTKGKTIPYLLKAHDSRLYFTFLFWNNCTCTLWTLHHVHFIIELLSQFLLRDRHENDELVSPQKDCQRRSTWTLASVPGLW